MRKAAIYAHAPFFFALVDGGYEEEKHNFEKEEKTGVAILISETVYESSENILDFTILALSLFFISLLSGAFKTSSFVFVIINYFFILFPIYFSLCSRKLYFFLYAKKKISYLEKNNIDFTFFLCVGISAYGLG